MRCAAVCSIPLVLFLSCAGPAPVPPPTPEHVREIEEWRKTRTERLTAEDGWLTLVGLHWLGPGENRFGSDPAGEVVLPEGKTPAHAGSLFLESGQVRVRPVPGSGWTLDGEPVGERTLKTDEEGAPDMLRSGDLSFYVIKREDRFGVRVKDAASPVRLDFAGLDYYPIDPRFRVEAAFVPYEEPKEIPIATVIGTLVPMKSPGYVEFDIGGSPVALEPLISGERYWFLFKDSTSGRETYGAGRYLYTDQAVDGKVIVDFNKAYNPPCVFTPYATCPVPPKQNVLKVAIEAGEKMYRATH